MKTVHLNCLPFICKIMQSSRANEGASDCSKTGLCIKLKVYGCSSEETHESKKEGKDQESIQSSPLLTQNYNWKVTTSQLDITNEGQEVSSFHAGDHKASINRCTRKHNKNKTKKSFKCDRGPIFQVTNLNRNLTQFRPSEIHFQPDPTERNCSLRHVTTKHMR